MVKNTMNRLQIKFWVGLTAAILVLTGCTKSNEKQVSTPTDESQQQYEISDAGEIATEPDAVPASDEDVKLPDGGASEHTKVDNCENLNVQFEDPSQWYCLHQTWICMGDKGCVADGRKYPKWGYIGQNYAPGFLPDMPSAFEDYSISVYKVDIKSWNDWIEDWKDGFGGWSCDADTCMCGNHSITKNMHCNGEVYYPSNDELCGDKKCGWWTGCKNGQCVCGDKTSEEITHTAVSPDIYECSRGHHELVCKDKNGCACGDGLCVAGGICRDGKCMCGDQDVSQVEKDYSCQDNNLYCANIKGCTCGNTTIPWKSNCIDQKGYCHGRLIDTEGMKAISNYSCDNDAPMLVCDRMSGCACGEKTCADGAECYNGECYCGKTKNVVSNYSLNRDTYKKCERGHVTNYNPYNDYWHESEFDYDYPPIDSKTGDRICPEYGDNHKTCRDCDDLTCIYRDADKITFYEWICRIYHGCTVNGKNYKYDEYVKFDSSQVQVVAKRCGTEDLRENYICKGHQQVCDLADGCKCGDQTIVKGDVCAGNVGAKYQKLSSKSYCKCDENAPDHCLANIIANSGEDDIFPAEIKCGNQAIYYHPASCGNDDNMTEIADNKMKLDVCCVCMSDEKIPDDPENYLCLVQFNPEKSVASDYVRVSSVKGSKFVPYVEAWECRVPEKCPVKDACALGNGFEYHAEDNTCRCGDRALEDMSVIGQIKCVLNLIVCNERKGCKMPGSDKTCEYGKICM